MKNYLSLLLAVGAAMPLSAKTISEITGPNGNLMVKVDLKSGKASYTVQYKDQTILEPSPLGLITSLGNLSEGLELNGEIKTKSIEDTYSIPTAKFSTINYVANEVIIPLKDKKNNRFEIVFRLSNNDIAFRYNLLPSNGKSYCRIERENTGFDFPSNTTTYITPQAPALIGWEETKPSYEEEYTKNEPVGNVSHYGVG